MKHNEETGPMLTAYTLGELEADQITEIETHLADCEACRAELEQIRETAGYVEARFEAEPVELEMSEGRRAEVVAGNVVEVEPAPVVNARKPHRNGWYLYGLSAAAAIGLIAVLSGTPGFLEEQTAKKIARAQADNLSFNTSLESHLGDGEDSGSSGLDGLGARQFFRKDSDQLAASEIAKSDWSDSLATDLVAGGSDDRSQRGRPALGLEGLELAALPADAFSLTTPAPTPSPDPSIDAVLGFEFDAKPARGSAPAAALSEIKPGTVLESLAAVQSQASSPQVDVLAAAKPETSLLSRTAGASGALVEQEQLVQLGREVKLAYDPQSGTSSAGEVFRYEKEVASGPLSLRIAPFPTPLPSPAPQHLYLNRRPIAPDMFFRNYGVNPEVETSSDALSTFSIDVDKASYALVRNYLNRNMLPPPEAVRVEEFVNYFGETYAAPREKTFGVTSELTPSPFRAGRHLLKIGIKGREIAPADRKPVVLTFVIDVSGSMSQENRLGLVKRTLNRLVNTLRPEDQIGIAIYGSNGRIHMEHVSMSNANQIRDAINRLSSGGSTNAEEGLRIGYEMARRAFDPGAVNRVLLCSDGVANVGQTGPDAILRVIEDWAGRDVYLTTIGFGMGNYNDVLMEQLADKGNGHYAYIDSDREARRFVERDLAGSMEVIAQDVKIQVAFDPAAVTRYRLLGFENRDVADSDFRNDAVDAGEISAGHAVTALYELQLAPEGPDQLGRIHLRFKQPDSAMAVKEISGAINRSAIEKPFASAGEHFQLTAHAAQFGEIMRRSHFAAEFPLRSLMGLYDSSLARTTSNPEARELRDLMARADRLVGYVAPQPSRDPVQGAVRPGPIEVDPGAPIEMEEENR